MAPPDPNKDSRSITNSAREEFDLEEDANQMAEVAHPINTNNPGLCSPQSDPFVAGHDSTLANTLKWVNDLPPAESFHPANTNNPDKRYRWPNTSLLVNASVAAITTHSPNSYDPSNSSPPAISFHPANKLPPIRTLLPNMLPSNVTLPPIRSLFPQLLGPPPNLTLSQIVDDLHNLDQGQRGRNAESSAVHAAHHGGAPAPVSSR